jgi:16S rRNA (guanine(966)-N(2))-methyltransferase RsmD
LRETLFNILAPRIEGAHFLDLCAGSGAVGIEALSRGASSAVFVERSPRACSIIQTNLDALGVPAGENASVRLIKEDSGAALRRLIEEDKRFDLVFFDPPYASAISGPVMAQLGNGRVLSHRAIVVVEHRVKTPPNECYGVLKMYRQVKQGESGLAMFAQR